MTRTDGEGPRDGAGATPRVVLRAAGAHDQAGVRRLLGAVGLPDAELEQSFPDGFVVAVRDAEIAGVAGVETRGVCGLLRSVAVAPALRGTGLGAALVAERVAWSLARGLTDLYLLTTAAADWFPRFGFRRYERSLLPATVRASLQFTSACPASAIAMRLELDPPPAHSRSTRPRPDHPGDQPR